VGLERKRKEEKNSRTGWVRLKRRRKIVE